MQLTKSFVTNELQKLVSCKADNWGSVHMESFGAEKSFQIIILQEKNKIELDKLKHFDNYVWNALTDKPQLLCLVTFQG